MKGPMDKFKKGLSIEYLNRYVVLTHRAFIIYKSEMAYISFPLKPITVLPICQIKDILRQRDCHKKKF
jgi:hypothetical protein